MIRKILVPTDFSACADDALDTAIFIAKKARAEIHLLHSLHLPVDWIRVPKNKEALYPDARRHIGKAELQLDKRVAQTERKGVAARRFLEFNLTYEDIAAHLDKNKTDMIVMGSHGTSGINELFIGSNAQKVIRLSPVPVLTVKKKSKIPALKNFVFASDFEEESYPAFMFVRELAEVFNSTIHLLTVNTPAGFESSFLSGVKMQGFVLRDNTTDKCSMNVYNEFNAEEGILKFSSEINADLIALVTHGRTGLSHLINGSVTESIANHAKVPVLSLKISVQKKK